MSKRILVTGSNSGFGKLIVETLAKEGNTVYATMRNTDSKNSEVAGELRAFATKNNYPLHVIDLDVSDEASISSAISKAVEIGGGIDVVVNNAGMGVAGITEATSIESALKQFDVNFWGCVRVNQAALPHLRSTGDGLIIHISSVVKHFPVPFMAFYNASKNALEGYSESLNFELASLGVESVVLQPGAYPTNFYGNIIPADREDIMSHYGDAMKMQEGMFKAFGEMLGSDDAPNPQEVADGVLALVNSEKGSRNRTLVVDSIAGQFAEAVVESKNEQTLKWMEAMGMN